MSPQAKTIQPHGVVSFFSGCGMLDLGFECGGFKTVMANEINDSFSDAYVFAREHMGVAVPPLLRGAFDRFFDADRDTLRQAMDASRKETGYVGFIGGPPCPDFSIAGKQAGHAGRQGRLTQDYFDLIGLEKPDFFLFENVRGLMSTAKHRVLLDELLGKLGDGGYALSRAMVNALHYGVPQDRNRVFVVGFRRDGFPGKADEMAAAFPWAKYMTHGDVAAMKDLWPAQETLSRDGSGNVTGPPKPCPDHITPRFRELTVLHWFEKNRVERHPNAQDIFQVKAGKARMQTVAEGDTSRKSFKRLHRWRYSPTAAYGNNEVHLHPWLDRRLSVSETMAIQSLPPAFVLPPGMTLSDKFKTVGNGVPFLLAQAIARAMADTMRLHA